MNFLFDNTSPCIGIIEMSAAEMEHIEVFSKWVGFADPPSHVAKLTIRRIGKRFMRQQALAGPPDEAPAELVARFLAVLDRQPVPQLDSALFDISESALHAHYNSLWTDDSPAHLLRVTFSTGRVVTVRTEAQHAYMLPLRVSDTVKSTHYETFDPRLSQAIASLLPDGYLEKERLAGHLGMLEHDLEEYAPCPDPSIASAEHAPLIDTAPADVEAILHKIFRTLSGEESPEEKAEAERTGRLSQRLLRRISAEETRQLLKRGANPCIADDAGQSALMCAAWPPFDRERFRVLVEAGADVEARRNDGMTGLHLVCAGGMADAAEEWLRAGADFQARTPEGATPLMLAAAWPAIVRSLLAAGADVNAVDQDGHSALVYAILKQSCILAEQRLEAMRAMIEAGADVSRRDRQGVTPLKHAQRMLDGVRLEQEVMWAFHSDMPAPLLPEGDEQRMAEAIVNLIASANDLSA